MDSLDQDTLRRSQVYLIEQIVIKELLDQLYQEGVFNMPMLDNIKVCATRSDQIRKLLTDLPKRGPTAFKTFLQCLRNTEQEHVADYLENKRRSLAGGDCASAAPLTQSVSVPNCAQQRAPAHLPDRPQSESALQTTPSDFYFIDRANPASVLIINNRFNGAPVSSHGRLPTRLGTAEDEKKLRDLFASLSRVYTKVEHDITGGMFLPTVINYFNAMTSSSLILIIMTHGHDGGILFGDDGQAVNIKDIIDAINAIQKYKDKPKMIVIQACRGAKPDEGVTTIDASEATDAQPPNMDDLVKSMEQMTVTTMSAINNMARLSDIFIFYSTVPGFASVRNKNTGTWFLQAFCDQVEVNYKATDMYSIAILINSAVSERKTTMENRNVTQVSQFVSWLKKKWYLLGYGQ